MTDGLTELELNTLFKDEITKVATCIRDARAKKMPRLSYDLLGCPPGIMLNMVLSLLSDQGFVCFGLLSGGHEKGTPYERVVIDLTRMRPKGE